MDQEPSENVRAAATALARGDLVGLPTETVYGQMRPMPKRLGGFLPPRVARISTH